MPPFGTIAPPTPVNNIGPGLSGLPIFLNIILQTLIMIAGVYSLINFIFAGYAFLSGAGDPKKIQDAWAKIWQTIIGLMVAAGSFLLAALLGLLLFHDATAILKIKVFGP
jgi:hypothetical protein